MVRQLLKKPVNRLSWKAAIENQGRLPDLVPETIRALYWAVLLHSDFVPQADKAEHTED